MNTVAKIIELLSGMDALADNSIKLTVEGFMPLCIEQIGTGPRGWPLVSVAHYYEQNGDLMRDPDMTFEVASKDDLLFHGADPASYLKTPLSLWFPVSYRQDNLGIDQEAVFTDDAGQAMVRLALVLDFKTFAVTWDRNLREQGFVAAAEKQAAINRLRDELMQAVKMEGITAIHGVDRHRLAKALAESGEYDYTAKNLTDEEVAALQPGWAAGWLSQP